MTEYRGKYRVESIRLTECDYGQPGWYFVTICTKSMLPFFGGVVNGSMRFSPLGEAACRFWTEIPAHFPAVRLDEFIVMPNHLHGIVAIEEVPRSRSPVETRHVASLQSQASGVQASNRFGPLRPGSLPAIIQSYKATVTRWGRKSGFHKFSWQPRYYEHIIRNEEALDLIREYILDNPAKWEWEKSQPENLFPLKRDARSRVSTKSEPKKRETGK